MADAKRSEESFDRVTRLAAAAMETVKTHPEFEEGDKLILFLDGPERSGLGMEGYERDMDAAVNLFLHLKAIFEANGKSLQLHALRQG